jgi:hypothetical protein
LFGNLGRNVVMGPDQRRMDVSASKRTQVTERVSLDFRAEAYNISNTPAVRNPDRDMSKHHVWRAGEHQALLPR